MGSLKISDLKSASGGRFIDDSAPPCVKKIISSLDGLDYKVSAHGHRALSSLSGVKVKTIYQNSMHDALKPYKFCIGPRSVLWANKKTIADLMEGERGNS